MPKELAHWILAEQAHARLSPDNPLKGMIAAHRDLYLAGAVLPDTLLHLFCGPHARTALALANRFHDASGNSYAPLIRAGGRFPGGLPPDMMSTLLGILAHMQADIVFHPYVFAVAGIDGMGRHYRMETAIDVSLVHSGMLMPARHLKELVAPRTVETLVSACCLIFDPEGEISRRTMERALSLHCRFQSMYDRTVWKIAASIIGLLPGPLQGKQHLFYPLDISMEDAILTGQNEWRHPVTGELRATGIEELANQAVQRSAALMERIGETGSLAAALTDPPGENLLTGMHGTTQQEMDFAGNFP